MNVSLFLINQRRMSRVEEGMIAAEILNFNWIGWPALLFALGSWKGPQAH
jgi:hypothetical protein